MIHLKDYVLSVNVRNFKVAISEMYTTELKFEADYLLKWFNAKCKSINLEVSNNAKRKCEIENPIYYWLCSRFLQHESERKSDLVFLYHSQLFSIRYVFSAHRNSTFAVGNGSHKHWWKCIDKH